MWVVYVIITMLVLIIVKYMYDSVYGKSKDIPTKDNLEENIKYCEESLDKVNPNLKSLDKPRISPPVHSMLELMLKDPEGFKVNSNYTLDFTSWSYKKGSINFSIRSSYCISICEGGTMKKLSKYYYINSASITESEGKYLEQGIHYIKQFIKRKKPLSNKERRHKTDRKIRKILEESKL